MADELGTISRSKAFDLAFKALSALVIPACVWIVRLEVNNAIQNERIQELQEDVRKNSAISNAVQQNTTALVKLETKLDGLGRDISDVKRLLDTPR